MRLEILEKKAPWPLKLARRLIGVTPGPPAVLKYRPGFFGRHYAAIVREALAGDGEWNKGEVELFAAFVSDLNECHY